MTSVRRALGLSFVERFAMIGLGLVSYVLIARLLQPREIGLYSVTAAVVSMLQVLREFGIGNQLIQTEELGQERLDTALGLAMLLAVAAFGLCYAASPWIGDFYGDPGLATILRIVALNLLLLPLCSISQSLLRRALKFGVLLHTSIAGGMLGLLVTLGMAYGGFGAASLAWGSVTTNAVVALGCWLRLPNELRPQRPSLIKWREFARVGRQTTASAVVTTISIDINDLVVGRVLGLEPVALLSRAMGLMNLWQRDLMTAARNVALPAFAKANREGLFIEPIYQRSAAAVLVLSLPYYGFIGLFPIEALRLLAGPQWDAAAPMVIAFAIAGAFASLGTLIPTLIFAIGRVDLAARLDITFALVRAGTVVSAAVVSKSMMVIALCFMAAFALSTVIFLWFKEKCLANDFRQWWRNTRSSLLVSLTCLLPAMAAKVWIYTTGKPNMALGPLLLVAASVIVLWFFALRWWRHPVAEDALYTKVRARMHREWKRAAGKP